MKNLLVRSKVSTQMTSEVYTSCFKNWNFAKVGVPDLIPSKRWGCWGREKLTFEVVAAPIQMDRCDVEGVMGIKRQFPIEKGFQIVIFFLSDLWHSFLKDVMVQNGIVNNDELSAEELTSASHEEKKKNGVLSGNNFVFYIVCGDPAGPGDYFEKVVEKRLNISPGVQRQGITVKEHVLFELAIDFCSYFNTKFDAYGDDYSRKGSLSYAIGWLEDMRNHPERHEKEWKLWDKTIDYVNSPGDKHLIF